ncbi:S-layer homology domain-containing protein [Dysosmobacter welbionis]|uniref:S-layer homology domain-containing protein n=5 Tax=Oscillospiraceae TaxID=216572 RepID=UPI0032BFD9B8
MKKFLSLVLALVMTMSLVTVSAGAKDFTDDSEITYKEAVDVISALGVVDGYSGGDFRPDDVLTRGAAAKIICNLILGPTTASALNAGTAPFKDVPVTNTFAGYITYCSQQGIISGYADGTFRPTGTLSGNAFMKMLLGALGYDSSIEGYTGPNWTVSVIKQAVGIGLDDGNDEFVGSKAVTRQEAALYAFNMLQATMVEYDQQNTIVVGDITINTTSSRSDVENNGKSDKYINSDGKMQFAEKYFTDLRLDDSGEDDFARPSNVWTLKSDEIGTYAKDADATYTTKVEVGDIYKDLGLNKTVAKDDVSVYVDGVSSKDHPNMKDQLPVAIKKGDDDTKFGANGVLTEVFYDEDDGTVTITEVNTYVGQVSKNVAATSKKDAYVVVSTLDVVPSESGNLEFETNEEFEEDAYVLYTYSEAAEEVKSVAAAEEVSGTVTKVINKASDDENKGLTIADTAYKTSRTVSGELLGDVSVKNDYTVYLDAYGYVIYIEEEELTAQDYALVLATANKSDFVGKKAELLFADGTTKVVTTEKDYSNDIADNTIVTYKVDSDNVYTLKEVSSKQDKGGYNKTVKETDISNFVLKNDKASINVAGTAVTANSKTLFVVQDTEDTDEYTAYTGIKNAPSITAASGKDRQVDVYYFCKNGSMVTVMFIMPESKVDVEDDSSKMLFLAGESVSDLIHDADDDYFEYNAVVNGEITTVKVAEELGDGLNGLYKSFSTNKYGVITKVTRYDSFDNTTDSKQAVNGGTGVDKRSGDYTVILDTADDNWTVSVDDDAAFYTVDKKGNISTGSYRSVVKDNNDKVYAVISDYLVQSLFIETVEDDEKDSGKVEIPSNVVVDISDLNSMTVTYRTGTDKPNAMDAVEYLKTALADKGYEVGTIKNNSGTYEFTLNDVEGAAKFNSSTGIIEGYAVSINGSAKLLAASTTIKDLALKGKYVEITDKDGTVDHKVTTDNSTTIKDGYKYEDGFYKVNETVNLSGDDSLTDNSSISVKASKLGDNALYIKSGEDVEIEITLAAKNDADFNLTAGIIVTTVTSNNGGALTGDVANVSLWDAGDIAPKSSGTADSQTLTVKISDSTPITNDITLTVTLADANA